MFYQVGFSDYMSNKYYIRTFGCQMNVYDSEQVGNILTQRGYLPVDTPKQADWVIVNTCTVRQHAEDRALSFIGRCKDKRVIVLGCVATRLKSELKNQFPQVQLVVGADEIYDFNGLVNQLNRVLPENKNQVDVISASVYPDLNLPVGLVNPTPVSTFVTISRGCSNYCSYCIVPYVRGNERTRRVEEIVTEIRNLTTRGIKEVTLLGQNVNSYKSGDSLSQELNFAMLLKVVNDIDALERVRFLTSHPKDLSEDTINCIRTLPKVCEHLHLPVQSGSSRILKLMNRQYTREEYLRLVEKLRCRVPQITISTDLIVGFPTETEDDFRATIDLVNRVQFEFAYVFKYSSRPGTKADDLTDDVPQTVKEKRLAELLSLTNEISRKKSHNLVNTEVEVLVESEVPQTGTKNKNTVPYNYSGRTRTNLPVNFISPTNNLIGKIVCVQVTGNRIHSLFGKLV